MKKICSLDGLYWIYGLKIDVMTSAEVPEQLKEAKKKDSKINTYFGNLEEKQIILWIQDSGNKVQELKEFIFGIEYIIDDHIADMGIKMSGRYKAVTEALSYIRGGEIHEFLEKTGMSFRLKDSKKYEYHFDLFKNSTLEIEFREEIKDKSSISLEDAIKDISLISKGTHIDGKIIIRTREVSTLIHEVGHYLDDEFSDFYVRAIDGIHKTSMKNRIFELIIDDIVEEEKVIDTAQET